MPVLAPGIRGQTSLDDRITIAGSIASGGVAQIVLVQQPRRLSLEICNTSAADVVVGIGPATATATVTSGTVASIAVANGGVGYTLAPKVRILGGLVDGDYQTSPSHPAVAHAVLTGTAVSSIVMDDVGVGYNSSIAPLVYLENPLPQLGGGAFAPSAVAGTIIGPGWTWSSGGLLLVPASAVALFGGTTGQTYTLAVGGIV